MLSSANVSFDPADFILVRLFRFTRHLLSLLQSLSARKRRIEWHRSRFGAGDLAVDRHDGAAVLGPGGRPHWRAHAFAGLSHAGDRGGLSRPWLCQRLSIDRAGDFGARASRHGDISSDDFGEFGDLARCRAPRFRPRARVGHRRLFYFDFKFSAGPEAISTLPRRHGAWP